MRNRNEKQIARRQINLFLEQWPFFVGGTGHIDVKLSEWSEHFAQGRFRGKVPSRFPKESSSFSENEVPSRQFVREEPTVLDCRATEQFPYRSDQSWPLLLISGNEFFKDSPDLCSTGTDVISLFIKYIVSFALLLVTNHFKLFYLSPRNSAFEIYYLRFTIIFQLQDKLKSLLN